ncbi:MAG: glycerate kinase [Chloroflexota bacterium]
MAVLDARLARFARVLEAATGRRERDTPGAGAAGGLGFALLSLAGRFGGLQLEPGVDLIAGAAGLEALLDGADLVITGEGRVDAQTALGKTAFGVARRARAAGVICIVVGEQVTDEGSAALAGIGALGVPVADPPMPVAEASAGGARARRGLWRPARADRGPASRLRRARGEPALTGRHPLTGGCPPGAPGPMLPLASDPVPPAIAPAIASGCSWVRCGPTLRGAATPWITVFAACRERSPRERSPRERSPRERSPRERSPRERSPR